MNRNTIDDMKDTAYEFFKTRKRRSDRVRAADESSQSFTYSDEDYDGAEKAYEVEEEPAKAENTEDMFDFMKNKFSDMMDMFKNFKASQAEKKEEKVSKSPSQKTASPADHYEYEPEEFDENYSDMEDELRENAVDSFSRVYSKYDDIKERSAGRIKNVREKIDEKTRKCDAAAVSKELIAEYDRKLDALRADLLNAVSDIKEDTQETIASGSSDTKASIENILKTLEETDKEIAAVKESVNAANEALKADIAKYSDSLSSYGEKFDELKTEKDEIIKAVESNKEYIEKVYADVCAISEKVDNIYSAVATVEKLNDSLFNLKKAQVAIKSSMDDASRKIKIMQGIVIAGVIVFGIVNAALVLYGVF